MSTPGPPGQGLRLTPFQGLRYVPEQVGSLAAVTSPPYDVVVRPDGVQHLETAEPHNIIRLILPQAPTAVERHRQAAGALDRWIAEGVLAADPRPAVYVYQQRDGDLVQRGLIGALRLSPPEAGVVLPHEAVMPNVVTERADLMRATAANLDPLLLSYQGAKDDEADGAALVIDRAVSTPPLLETTTEDGVQHRLWSVTEPADLAHIDAALSGRQALIADGHHRWATYLRLRAEQRRPSPWDYGLVLLVDSTRYPLRVRAIHRLLRQLPVDKALSAVGGAFRVRRVSGPLDAALGTLSDPDGAVELDGNAFLLAGDGAFHLLDRPDPEFTNRTVPPGHPELWRSLDATVLHALLLERLWGIPDRAEHIGYLHDPRTAVEHAERHGGTAVLMRPVREDVVRTLARAGVTMPHKSTSFGPKPATGLVLRRVPRT